LAAIAGRGLVLVLDCRILGVVVKELSRRVLAARRFFRHHVREGAATLIELAVHKLKLRKSNCPIGA